MQERRRQVDETPNADAQRDTLTVKPPKACELYYTTCAAVDQRNRYRQSTLQIETKFQTKDWSKQVNLTIFGMCVVESDNWDQVYTKCLLLWVG